MSSPSSGGKRHENLRTAETRSIRRGLRRNCRDGDRLQLGGWETGGTVRQMATEQSRTEVVTALTSMCLNESKWDPQLADLVMKNGWATICPSPTPEDARGTGPPGRS